MPQPATTAFISYAYDDRAHGVQVKALLSDVGFRVFLAHDDLEVSDEWRTRILEDLQRCDLFVPLLSANFVKSLWAPQEVGLAVSRLDAGVIIAPLSIDGTRSFGFISHLQSPRIPSSGITDTILVQPLARRLPRQILPRLIARAAKAGSFRHAEALIEPLVPLFQLFNQGEAQGFAEAAIDNAQIWAAALCQSDYLPEFISVQGHNLEPDTLRALQYQVENQQRYRAREHETS